MSTSSPEGGSSELGRSLAQLDDTLAELRAGRQAFTSLASGELQRETPGNACCCLRWAPWLTLRVRGGRAEQQRGQRARRNGTLGGR